MRSEGRVQKGIDGAEHVEDIAGFSTYRVDFKTHPGTRRNVEVQGSKGDVHLFYFF